MSWQTTFAPTGTLAEGTDRYLGPARVVEVDEEAGRARIEIPAAGAPRARWAEVALPDAAAVEPGGAVLVVTAGEEAAYVIGVLGRRADRTVASRAGSSASIVHAAAGERVEVRNERRQLLFEYDEARRQARLHVPSGDLDVLVPDGDLTLASNQAVRLRGRTVEVTATTAVRVAVHDLAARLLSTFGLTGRGAALRSRHLRVETDTGDLAVKAGRLTGDRMEADVTSIRTRAERIETSAGTVVERAGEVLQEVKGLIQTRAGRVRSLIAGTWHQRAGRADLRSREVFKVDGDRIHLG